MGSFKSLNSHVSGLSEEDDDLSRGFPPASGVPFASEDGQASSQEPSSLALARLLRDQEFQDRERKRLAELNDWGKSHEAEPLPLGIRRSTPRKWTEEEDQMLRAAVEANEGRNWKKIAESVPGRKGVQCLQRWKKVLAPGLRKGAFTEEEDAALHAAVGEGMTNWGDVARRLSGRTAKQCRERWTNYLAPDVSHTMWDAEEDALLLELELKYGRKWALIAREMPGRSENAVKLRFKSLDRQKHAHPTAEDEPPSTPPSSESPAKRVRMMVGDLSSGQNLLGGLPNLLTGVTPVPRVQLPASTRAVSSSSPPGSQWHS
jgi:hypothetical protein